MRQLDVGLTGGLLIRGLFLTDRTWRIGSLVSYRNMGDDCLAYAVLGQLGQAVQGIKCYGGGFVFRGRSCRLAWHLGFWDKIISTANQGCLTLSMERLGGPGAAAPAIAGVVRIIRSNMPVVQVMSSADDVCSEELLRLPIDGQCGAPIESVSLSVAGGQPGFVAAIVFELGAFSKALERGIEGASGGGSVYLVTNVFVQDGAVSSVSERDAEKQAVENQRGGGVEVLFDTGFCLAIRSDDEGYETQCSLDEQGQVTDAASWKSKKVAVAAL